MLRQLTSTHGHRQLELAQLSCCCAARCYASLSRPQTRIQYDEGYANARPSPSRTPYRRGDRPIENAERELPQLPRYLRREARATPQAPLDKRDSDTFPSQAAPRVYRSRHLDPTQKQESKVAIKLLEPHVLSTRLKKLCDANKLDAAITMLKNAPLDAQNTPVWNTCIWESMKAKRFKLGYQLFIDMKRRGFSPTTRTFQTMFTGLSRIESWLHHPKQLENARSVYESYQRHMASVKSEDPNSPELSVDPLAGYIKILGDAGCHQEIFDVYYAMESEGPLAPNHFIFTAMFQALSAKHDTSGGSSPTQANIKNAADARLLWTQMQKAMQKTPGFKVDAILVTSAITALSRGRPADQDFAFQLVRDYYGLTAPGDPLTKGSIPLAPQSLAAILRLCNNSEKYVLCDHFFQQVKRRPEALGGVAILDRGHLEEVLKARLALREAGSAYYCLDTLEWMLRQEITGKNGPKIRPALTTFNLVLTACWRDGDWKTAARVFDLMTGYHSHDFMDGAVSTSPRLDKRGVGRNMVPTPETLSSMLRAALGSRDRANVRQCLRIADYLGAYRFFQLTTKAARTEESPKSMKNMAFYISKLASALVEAVAYVSDASARRHTSQDEMRRWQELAADAARYEKRANQRSDFIPTVTKRPQEEKIRLTQYEKALRQ
ncbi:hypothetical protein Hypma_010203 [Hypsizygus marmoreus]|uniref:Uncharacterized protein n=1 Tax=Hypsizygus marmoreus TaxID=39966 RepID=A0A369JU38_HYPMA|nr:hypothetical protein Hypma_010203 [Hypsizygus marmoreus]